MKHVAASVLLALAMSTSPMWNGEGWHPDAAAAALDGYGAHRPVDQHVLVVPEDLIRGMAKWSES
jgi:hypothetical protein